MILPVFEKYKKEMNINMIEINGDEIQFGTGLAE
jgi:hypothetical protein